MCSGVCYGCCVWLFYAFSYGLGNLQFNLRISTRSISGELEILIKNITFSLIFNRIEKRFI